MTFWLKNWKTIAAAVAVVAGGIAVKQGLPPLLRAAEPGRTIAYTRSIGDKPMLTAFKPRSIEHVDDDNFDEKVLESDVPVLVDFYADWCGPCKMLAPVLTEFAREAPLAKVVKVNIDHSPDLASRYGIGAIPTLLVFKNGKATAQHMGLANKNTLKSLVSR
jgi:thioredoxin 1